MTHTFCHLHLREVMKKEELQEWLSDARHYSDCDGPGWDFPGRRSMAKSARRTVELVTAALERN